MSTNGLVVILDGDDIYYKIIAGCSGQAAPALAEALVGSGARTLRQIYDLALSVDFGCRSCLVVMTAYEAWHNLASELPQCYWDTYWNVTMSGLWHGDQQPGAGGFEYHEKVQLQDLFTERVTHA